MQELTPANSPTASGFERGNPFPQSFGAGEANFSGISWAAVLGGAFAGASLSLVLFALGSGLGLSSVSPWADAGASAAVLGTAAIVWLVLTQLLSSGLAGYLAGRLRTKWSLIHNDEVYFRDTAHGFLAWAVGMVITVYFLASATSAFVGSTTRVGPAPAVGAADGWTTYYADRLVRVDGTGAASNDATLRGEIERVFVHSLRTDGMTVPDRTYLTRIVASRTGLTPTEAEQRVSTVMAEAQQAAETARKAAARLLLWSFVSLMIGAFSASYSATIGGRQRDKVQFA